MVQESPSKYISYADVLSNSVQLGRNLVNTCNALDEAVGDLILSNAGGGTPDIQLLQSVDALAQSMTALVQVMENLSHQSAPEVSVLKSSITANVLLETVRAQVLHVPEL